MLTGKEYLSDLVKAMLKTGRRPAAVCFLIVILLSSVLSARGRRDSAFEHVRDVQERNTERLMGMKNVEGTAIGLDQDGQPMLIVLTAEQNMDDVPDIIENVPVRIVAAGKIYSIEQRDIAYKLPKAPTHFTAETSGSRQVMLKWNRNRRKDISGFNIYRSVAGGPYNRIASVPAEVDEYSDERLIPSTTYCYVVTTIDESENESPESRVAQTRTEACSVEPAIGPRPAPIGVSTGHPDITAGTIGCRVKDWLGNVYGLSNNHVYADENRAKIGDFVLQPGSYDGGEDPRDFIGILYDFEPVVFGWSASNRIDAAIIATSMDLLGNSTPPGSYGMPSSTTASAYIGLAVQKHGRTTGRTYGEVVAVNAEVYVHYETDIARFVGQVVISPGTFAAPGDSGSLVVTQQGNHPVGLLFAGSSLHIIANPIDDVLDAFGVTIDGQ